jgi:DNA-binding transcriptional LysR family regulator
MTLADASLTALRVFREVAERGTLTAAATALGYTQSAVSRQIASLERAAGVPLLERSRAGVRLTPMGQIVVRRAAAAVDQVDAAAREIGTMPGGPAIVRLGWFACPGAFMITRALSTLRRTHPAITVTTREGGSTSALVRALRAGTVDLALLASTPPFRPLDAETPSLELQTLSERSLRVAVPTTHPLARGDYVDVADLHGQQWIAEAGMGASASAGGGPPQGVWPGLDERPNIAHVARDALTKLNLVAAGCGLTTVPLALAAAAPPGVRILPVHGGPPEQRRVVLARLPGPQLEPIARLAEALRTAALEPG